MKRQPFKASALIVLLSCSVFSQKSEPPPVVNDAVSNPVSQREVPARFRSDGCTMFPDGNYRECCVSHDEDYYFGGSGKERWRSDKRLYKCVKAKRGWQNKIAAPVMWIGVRVGGVSFLPTPFRWGFGKDKGKDAQP